MDDRLMQALNYLQPPPGYFWHWTEGGRVIEWSDGSTVCFRDELQTVLRELAPGGLPPLGPLLLLLAACRDSSDPMSKGIISILHLGNTLPRSSAASMKRSAAL